MNLFHLRYAFRLALGTLKLSYKFLLLTLSYELFKAKIKKINCISLNSIGDINK